MGNCDFQDELLLLELNSTRVQDVQGPKEAKSIVTSIFHMKLRQAYKYDNNQNQDISPLSVLYSLWFLDNSPRSQDNKQKLLSLCQQDYFLHNNDEQVLTSIQNLSRQKRRQLSGRNNYKYNLVVY